MSAATSSRQPVMELKGISRRFGSIQALSDVSLSLYPGETLGLLGDNGAGKSTLIKILSGVHSPTGGRILLEGKEARFGSPRDARRAGVETVYQDLGLVDDLSVARNFFLGNELRSFGFLRHHAMKDTALAAIRETGVRVDDADAPVRSLSGGERQAIAIARAWHFGSRVLILDEPTSALSIQETQQVFRYMKQAKEKGMSVVFITHNLHHAQEACDRLFVLRHGQAVGEFPATTDRQELENWITEGRAEASAGGSA